MVIEEEARDRIKEDISILAAMVAAVPAYLNSTAVYYPLSHPRYPQLTLGNYLMRQRRLQAIDAEMSQPQKGRLEAIHADFQQVVRYQLARVATKGHKEGHARRRRWERTVSELLVTPKETVPYYATVVENRVMLAELLPYLRAIAHRFDDTLPAETAVVDQKLRPVWQPGPFVWPALWQPAYAKEEYWWLYGQPLPA